MSPRPPGHTRLGGAIQNLIVAVLSVAVLSDSTAVAVLSVVVVRTIVVIDPTDLGATAAFARNLLQD